MGIFLLWTVIPSQVHFLFSFLMLWSRQSISSSIGWSLRLPLSDLFNQFSHSRFSYWCSLWYASGLYHGYSLSLVHWDTHSDTLLVIPLVIPLTPTSDNLLPAAIVLLKCLDWIYLLIQLCSVGCSICGPSNFGYFGCPLIGSSFGHFPEYPIRYLNRYSIAPPIVLSPASLFLLQFQFVTPWAFYWFPFLCFLQEFLQLSYI